MTYGADPALPLNHKDDVFPDNSDVIQQYDQVRKSNDFDGLIFKSHIVKLNMKKDMSR